MLVLSRKTGEAVVIAGGITVRVLSAGGGRIRLGVEAPDEVLVLREEVAARLDVPLSTRTESKPTLAVA
jgi:carbon storage regulator